MLHPVQSNGTAKAQRLGFVSLQCLGNANAQRVGIVRLQHLGNANFQRLGNANLQRLGSAGVPPAVFGILPSTLQQKQRPSSAQ